MRTRTTGYALKFACTMLDILSFALDGVGRKDDLSIGISVAAFFNCLPNARQRFCAIARVPAGSVDQVLHPWAAWQTLLAGQLPLSHRKLLVQRLQAGRRKRLVASS